MHVIQEKILKLLEKKGALKNWTLRSLGEMVGDGESPQRIKHHLTSLQKHGFVILAKSTGELALSSVMRKKTSGLISLPILGSANCGEALELAENVTPEGFLRVSARLIGPLPQKAEHRFFVVRAVGSSMNRANISGEAIDDGDYVVVDRDIGDKKRLHGKYVLSLIDGAANIKKFLWQQDSGAITLVSESSQNFSPIFIHQDDFPDYTVAGRIVRVLKKPV
jgi:SOS-response transcriptional repressor LexA